MSDETKPSRDYLGLTIQGIFVGIMIYVMSVVLTKISFLQDDVGKMREDNARFVERLAAIADMKTDIQDHTRKFETMNDRVLKLEEYNRLHVR